MEPVLPMLEVLAMVKKGLDEKCALFKRGGGQKKYYPVLRGGGKKFRIPFSHL